MVFCLYSSCNLDVTASAYINYILTFPFVMSYFGSVTLEIIIKSTIGEVVTL